VIQKLANTASVREASMKPLEPFVKAHNEELKVSRWIRPIVYACNCVCV